jgi:tetratricopeptide (TPR) repeat protein
MNTTKLIEAYLDGSLDKDKAEEIEARAECDIEFAQLIRLHKEINESIRDNELHYLRQTLKKISTQNDVSNSKPVFPSRRIVQIAAAFLFIIVIGITVTRLFFQGTTGPDLFEKFYVKYEPDVITRSGNIFKSDLENAQFQYQTGNYEECERILDSIVRSDKQNYMALFYLGLVGIELQHPKEAIGNFLKIPPNWNNPYSIHRNWYLALCFIETEQGNKAIPLLKRLSNEDSFYSERAIKILDAISI